MSDLFKAYAPLNKDKINEIWKSDNTIFILDTNILLNLYSYRKETQKDFYTLLEKLKGKIWIPYHVMFEYHKNRLNIIAKSEQTNNGIIKSYEKKLSEFLKNKFEKKLLDEIQIKIENFLSEIEQLLDNGVSLNKTDTIYEKIMGLITIGKPDSKEEIEKIIKDGECRFKDKRPPGYSDDTKDEYYYHMDVCIPNKYGDLIIWEQIKKHVKKDTSINNVIFITDDNKVDWVRKYDNGEEKKIIHARYELIEELLTEANHVEHFIINDSISFINNSSLFDLDLKDNTVMDVKYIADNNLLNNTDLLEDEDYSFQINNEHLKTMLDQFKLDEKKAKFRLIELKNLHSDLIKQKDKLSLPLHKIKIGHCLKQIEDIEKEIDKIQRNVEVINKHIVLF